MFQRIFISGSILGAAEMAHQDDAAAVAKYFLDGRNGGTHTGVVGDLELIVEGNVEIHPDQGFLPFEIILAELAHMSLVKGPGLLLLEDPAYEEILLMGIRTQHQWNKLSTTEIVVVITQFLAVSAEPSSSRPL